MSSTVGEVYRLLFDVKDIPEDLRDCFEEVETQCGAGWVRYVERTKTGERHISPKDENPNRNDGPSVPSSGLHSQYFTVESTTTGWAPGCTCDAEIRAFGFPKPRRRRKRVQRLISGDWFRRCRKYDPIPATCLDPFSGAGTVGLVAEQLGRDSILCELNADYAQMARERIDGAPVVECVVDGVSVEMEQARMFGGVEVG